MTPSSDDNNSKQDLTSVYLWTVMSGFILLWFNAMAYMSIFDALILFILIVCSNFGFVRGGVRELFGFFGAVVVFLFAINSYHIFYKWTEFSFGLENDVWAQVFWFLFLLASGWIVCQLLSFYLEKSVQKGRVLKVANKVNGALLGLVKGALLSYILVVVTKVSGVVHQRESLEAQFTNSQAVNVVNSLEGQFKVLQNLDKMDLAGRMEKMHEKIQIERTGKLLFPSEPKLEGKVQSFFMWLSEREEVILKLNQSREAYRLFRILSQLESFQTAWTEEQIVSKIESQPDDALMVVCKTLQKKEFIDIFQDGKVKAAVLRCNFEKIAHELENLEKNE